MYQAFFFCVFFCPGWVCVQDKRVARHRLVLFLVLLRLFLLLVIDPATPRWRKPNGVVFAEPLSYIIEVGVPPRLLGSLCSVSRLVLASG